MVPYIDTFIAILAIGLTQWKIQKTNIREFQSIADKVDENERNLSRLETSSKEKCEEIKLEIEQTKRDKVERTRDIYHEIEILKDHHKDDINKVYETLDKKIDKLESKMDVNHEKVIAAISKLTVEVTRVCTQYEEHSKKHN